MCPCYSGANIRLRPLETIKEVGYDDGTLSGLIILNNCIQNVHTTCIMFTGYLYCELQRH